MEVTDFQYHVWKWILYQLTRIIYIPISSFWFLFQTTFSLFCVIGSLWSILSWLEMIQKCFDVVSSWFWGFPTCILFGYAFIPSLIADSLGFVANAPSNVSGVLMLVRLQHTVRVFPAISFLSSSVVCLTWPTVSQMNFFLSSLLVHHLKDFPFSLLRFLKSSWW